MSTAIPKRLPPRRLAANLDAEEHWGRLELRDHPGPRPARPPLARAAIEAAAGFGTLMRVLAQPGDRLHTLAPVDPERLAPHEGVAEVVLESGTVDDDRPVLPWAWAPPWTDLSGNAAVIAARVNDRRFGLELARELGVDDPLARCFDEPEALIRHLEGEAAEVREWVLKAPFSAAGRSRFVHRPNSDTPTDVRQLILPPAIRRLFRQHGNLVFEPWHRRTLDLGLLFEVVEGQEGGWRRTTALLHRLHVDALGRFRGIELDPSEPWLDEDHRQQLEVVAEGVGRALGEAGYRGPVSVDLWLHRVEGSVEGSVEGDERPRLHPLGEINARLSFGWLARAWARALGTEQGRLILGTEPEPSEGQLRTLLHPDSAGRGGAWFVIPWSAMG